MAAYEQLGRKLRDARLEQKVELQTIAQKLHIRQTYLQSLEDGELEQLPGDAFVHGYISRYAAYLNLDPDKLLAEYRSIGSLPAGSLRYIPDSMREQQHPGWHLVVITLCMTAILMLSWSVGRLHEERVEKAVIQEVSEEPLPRPQPRHVPCSETPLWPPCYYVLEKPQGIMDLQ